MNKQLRGFPKVILTLLSLLVMADFARAQPFTYNDRDLALGFRKTGTYIGSYEVVADLGPVTNYLSLAPGTSLTITQYKASQIDPDSYANWTNLQWSVTADCFNNYTNGGSGAVYPRATFWVTVPRVNGQTGSLPVRTTQKLQQPAMGKIYSILQGAATISATLASNQDNTATCVQEPYSTADGENYGAFMADPDYTSSGDLDSYGPETADQVIINLESTTVAPFSSPVISDFYQLLPTGYADPNTGLTSGTGYNVGYFQLNVNGTMTFTRASATVAAPVASFTGSPTTGVAPLAVTFTDSSTGSITNWLWTLGDGHSVTNTSNASVGHVYTNAGTYTVSLTVSGAGGNNTLTKSGYVVVTNSATSVPRFGQLIISGGQLVFTGTNGTASAQYRVLTATNLTTALTNWVAVATNYFSSGGTFTFTNSAPKATGFFRLVSP